MRKADQIEKAKREYPQNPALGRRKLRKLGVSKAEIRQVHDSYSRSASRQSFAKPTTSTSSRGHGGAAQVLTPKVPQSPRQDYPGVDFSRKPLPKYGVGSTLHDINTVIGMTGFKPSAVPGHVRELIPGSGEWQRAHRQLTPQQENHVLEHPTIGVFPGAGLGLGRSLVKKLRLTSAARTEAKAASRAVRQMPAEMSPDVQEAAKKVTAALSFGGAKKLRKEQDILYSEERAKRAQAYEQASRAEPGLKGHIAAKQALAGELPKLHFDALKKAGLDQDAVDKLHQYIAMHPRMLPFQKVSTHDALVKAFAGRVPTDRERMLLHSTFGPEFTRAITEAQPRLARLKALGYDVANIPRSLMSSADISAPFRQALVAGARHPRLFAKNFKEMVKQFGSERVYQESMNRIHQHPDYAEALDAGLPLTELAPTGSIGLREEQFPSQLAERIPGAGRVVRASSRAYTGMLDNMRLDMYTHHRDAAMKFYGGELTNAQKRGLARFIGSATGRGNLGKLQSSAVALNTLFFSPRLLASRLNFLNPAYYARLDPYSRRQALRSLVQLSAFVTGILATAKYAGAKVNTDPRSTDWAKIRVGNTRIDLLGGFQQPIRLAAQLATQETIDPTSGQPVPMGSGFGQQSSFDALLKFGRSKLAPVPSAIVDTTKGTTFGGQPVTPLGEAGSHLIPLAAQDAWNLRHHPAAALGAYGLSGVGIGVQSYPSMALAKVRKRDTALRDALTKELQQHFHIGLTPELKQALKLREQRDMYLRQHVGPAATPVQRFDAQVDLLLQLKKISPKEARGAKNWSAKADPHKLRSESARLAKEFFGGVALQDAGEKLRERGSKFYIGDY